ncbi:MULTISPECIES: 50S ribosomal protein L9 [Croceibacter]|jgi:large subunit ribosomal protein L9|uniref:Large ribosomal subunit protein bL9 n=1 Tax=Croceibacter atlanticus (strain ATCC BAA-628 / JCM 21780 / CIP 108009 / IAM 15332 / KCTC 12090 / HTCC2559) TaxID=216432 RepID=A3U970_CROAH|nr:MULTISPECIES: 50S ribosomal protein L9 [Croceibacter]HAT70181.1 50S ribosomal protein L9 [Flavobacteriaceae bacterium]EAP86356.1 ribosomal protein L9 [Croceibacter atlanticus HTCC2559]MBG25788.1 50S ribosomal protein L9 [Croceibacter sp.]MBW4971166.1 50S ribosomal protein L9 [Croceibacter atlanticus]WSP34038.1 50S ribosomal protein L9 [Croceibacter atlanticus]|tara:strand:+ start:1304 stop:1753 length:450 start_codon:yes stop_codon:yes gene_type:complete
MQLILKQDVENLGFTDDVVEVKPGYGRNFLIPQGKAVLATPSSIKSLEETLKQRSYKERKAIEAAKSLAEKLNSLDLTMTAKAGEADKMFGSISNADLSERLEKEGIEIDKKYISIAGGNIKRLGQYEATVRFHREVVETVTFDVVGEN